jgi:3-oxoacyl-[acyl-carrier-protein] synthase II
MRRRAVITGMGVVCSAGADIVTFADNVAAGKPCFSHVEDPRIAHFRGRYAGIVNNLRLPAQAGSLSEPMELDRYTRLAILAAQQAMAQAGLGADRGRSAGLVFATCSGPMLTIENHYNAMLQAGAVPPASSYFSTRYFSAARILSHLFRISGPSVTVTTACSASINAIGTACDYINMGRLDTMLVGGSDSFSLTTLAGVGALKATCQETCAPFSRPVGMNLGEGAAFVVLEERDHALARGVPILAEILGFGSSNDAYHATSPDPAGRGPALAMARALKDAGVGAEAITYINAHGTGTEANDKAETKAVRRLFGDLAERIPMSSTKAVTGHCLGAAGMVELLATIVCGAKDVLPPTAHFSEPREGCLLDCVREPGRRWHPKGPFMKNNLAFGGNNASVIVSVGSPSSSTDALDRPAGAICITGIGVVSPAGVGIQPFMHMTGRSKSGTNAPQTAATVPVLDERAVDRRLDLRGMDRASQFAAVAAHQALTDASFGNRAADRADVGFFMNCGHGPAWAESEHITSLLHDNFPLGQLTSFPYVVPNSVTGNVCRALALAGHNNTLCLGQGAGLLGFPVAVNAVRNGRVSALLCGAADELSEAQQQYLHLSGFYQHARPAEAAVMVMLESEFSAATRGAKPLGYICGTASSVDIDGPVMYDSDSRTLASTVDKALSEAGITPKDVGIVCLNKGNAREAGVVRSMFGVEVETIDVSAAVGLAETSFPLLNLAYGILHPSLEGKGKENYILSLFCSANGSNVAVIAKSCPGR